MPAIALQAKHLIEIKEGVTMSNMSYCRFRNTNQDLTDCFEALNNDEELSDSEANAAISMLINMVEFLEDKYIITNVPADYKEDIRKYINSFGEYEEEE